MFWRQRVCQSGVAAVPAQDVGHLQRRAARLAARFVDLICQSSSGLSVTRTFSVET